MKKPRTILAPTDFSDVGQAAIKCAADYARFFEAELHLLNVAEDYTAYYPDAGMVAASELTVDMDAMLASANKQLAEVQIASDIKVVRVVEIGTPQWTILNYAKDNDIDMIVVSTHGRTGLKHLFMGSVAEKVVRRASCPVLTIRPEGYEVDDAPPETPADEKARMKMLAKQQAS